MWGCLPCWNNHILGGRHLPGLWLPTEEQIQGERCHRGGQEQKPLQQLQGGAVKLLPQGAECRSCGFWGGAGFWLAPRAGQGLRPGRRVRSDLAVTPPELLGGFWDEHGDSSTWLSPLLSPEQGEGQTKGQRCARREPRTQTPLGAPRAL